MESTTLETLGLRIRTARLARGWSQRAFCDRAGLSPRFAVQLEAGQANPSLSRLADVARALDCSMVTLLSGLGPHTDEPDRAARLVAELPPHARERAVSRLAPSPTRVALIGLRGAGKSTIGAQAAQALGCPFMRLDEEVERRTGLSLGTLFELQGPEGYRDRARETLQALLDAPGHGIVEIGGSLVMDEAARSLLWSRAVVIWLSASPASHLGRVAAQGDTRPMAGHGDARAEIEAILAGRRSVHEQAHHHIDTDIGLNHAVEAVIRASRPTVSPATPPLDQP